MPLYCRLSSFYSVIINLVHFTLLILNTVSSDLCNHDELAQEASETEEQDEDFSPSFSAQNRGEQVHH